MPSADAVIAAVGQRCGAAVLDSASSPPLHGRYTIVACDPVATFEHSPGVGDPFEAMRDLLGRTGMLHPIEPAPGVPFAGGWIGYYAYEAGRYIERLPTGVREDLGLPKARFSLYDSAAVFDRLTGCWTVAAMEVDWDLGPLVKATSPRPDARERIEQWKSRLAQAEQAHPTRSVPAAYPAPSCNLSTEQHLEIVRRGRAYIAAGDVFQVNLARRESTPAREDPLAVYLRLRKSNAGAYSAFLRWQQQPRTPDASRVAGTTAILSSSPELFLAVSGREVVTRPIKGTRPRSADPAVDASLQAELASSHKDRAELAMIVDLERNDLGRVCEFGSIKVVGEDSLAAPFALEAHPTVHHLLATVTGRLAEGRDMVDLLRATFPGGSITGAPKVRAMEIIDALEPTERSVYTGAIGFISPGRMVMNIAIRTMIHAGDMLHWYAGGGIVADSDPQAEYEETRAKALGMRRALGLDVAETPGDENREHGIRRQAGCGAAGRDPGGEKGT